jgi:small-conductance mechanosensitive channel
MKKLTILPIILLINIIFTSSVFSDSLTNNLPLTHIEADKTENLPQQPKDNITKETIKTLESFVIQKNNLQTEIEELKKKITKTILSSEKKELNSQLSKLKETLKNTQKHLSEIAAGIDISSLSEQKVEVFEFQKEVLALIKPIVDEVKDMTSDMRLKSALKDKILYYNSRIPTIEAAITNLKLIKQQTENNRINLELELTQANWEKQRSFMLSEQQAAQLQLNKVLLAENNAKISSVSWFKSFFQKRGLYLSEAIVVIIMVIILSKLSYSAMQRFLPGFKAKHRSFKIRLLELIHRILTIVFIIIGPMVVFYLVEDWVLFSLGILLLIGIGWTLRHALPFYWSQIYIFLNMGSVREGERIELQGLPWQIKKINVYCTLVNPMAALQIRIPINELVGKISRPYTSDEPWFPCKKGDWVILNDGVRGMVNGISQELVQLIERGGSRKTYQTQDFLANSPRNLSITFRIKETIGITYNLQQDSVHKIPGIMSNFLQSKVHEEGYGDNLLNLNIEFEYANDSSLDIVVIADFKGDVAELYNRLRRRIQRWGVEACTEHQWEIPFPQLSIHKQ